MINTNCYTCKHNAGQNNTEGWSKGRIICDAIEEGSNIVHPASGYAHNCEDYIYKETFEDKLKSIESRL